MDHTNPKTITELLVCRAEHSAGRLYFLNGSGDVTSSMTYRELVEAAQRIANTLLSSGLKGGGSDIVVTNFTDQRNHILIFWGCCFAGIPVSPTPQFHPDATRQTLLLEHLQDLFHKPTFVSDKETLKVVVDLVPGYKTLDIDSILGFTSSPCGPFNHQIYPSRVASPDETVVLMLTSGSTGNSKGVVLPHSVLLSAIQGKAAKHGTKENDVFLNWINFDHVANVTEAHLHALWAGASQYQVSPSAIIGKPRNLLDWCSKYHITHTFSPNFLLAQICRDVTLTSPPTTNGNSAQLSNGDMNSDPNHVPNMKIRNSLDLSSLRVFITGGEANPVKTAVEFSDLIERFGAPRTTIRAAFGMTETAAGSIYNTTPILPAISDYDGTIYLSVGSPCIGLHMRIVDPSTSLPCDSNVSGELQVSGPSVFSQYYANPHVTRQSFSDDGWFITGDVALIDEHGHLVMLGRQKDDINVNGVKHPSVDIELYIQDSKIPGVEPSFVFVSALRLAEADTETYAVFYQHSSVFVENIEGGQLTDDDIKSVLATNRSIRAVCSVFCSQAPHVVLPLPRHNFVKTALGKVSRNALVKAYQQGKFTSIEKYLSHAAASVYRFSKISRSPLDEVLCEWVSEAFNVELSTLNVTQNLFDLGASSMHLIRFKQFLQERFHIRDLATIELLKRPTISDVSSYVAEMRGRGNQREASYNPLICLNPRGSKPPLYLVHPGVGEVLIFINLARVLDDNRPVYALRAKGFEAGETPPKSFEEMVDTYTSAIEANNPTGPYFIAGYSFGAAVAVEISKSLERKGKIVAWTGILNLPPFIQFRVKELIWVEVLLNLCMFLALITSDNFESFKSQLVTLHPGGNSDTEPSKARQMIEWTFSHCNQERLAELRMPIEDFHRWINVAYEVSCTGRSYEPSSAVHGALTTVFCAIPLPSMGTREEYKRDRLSKWKDYSGKNFEMIDVEGEHYTMISEEHVESFALHMKSAIHRAESLLLLAKPPVPDAPSKLNFDAVPTVDFSLSESDPPAYFKQLKYALEDVGFGIFINVPGFDDVFQKSVFDVAEKFFNKPAEWKASLGTDNSVSLRGHFRSDTIDGPHKAFAEAYRFGAERPVHDDPTIPFWLRIHEGPNQWPCEADIPLFRERIETLFERYHHLNIKLNGHIADLLEIPRATIDDFYPTKLEFNAAIWHYLPLSPEMRATERDGFVNGMHEHRDPSTFLTCLIQSRPGLQVQNHAGDWIDIPMVKGGVVCNVGMQLMRLTGGKLVATTHRVNTLKIDVDRYTIPYVLTTKLEKPVIPLPQFDSPAMAKMHVAPNKKIQALMAIEDPGIRSGYARLSLFPAAAKKMYPAEWEEAKKMGIV